MVLQFLFYFIFYFIDNYINSIKMLVFHPTKNHNPFIKGKSQFPFISSLISLLQPFTPNIAKYIPLEVNFFSDQMTLNCTIWTFKMRKVPLIFLETRETLEERSSFHLNKTSEKGSSFHLT